MRNQLTLIREKEHLTTIKSVEIDDELWLQRHVESWTGKHIARWIEGLGDMMNPYLGTIRDNIRSGKHLHLIDNDYLLNMGISGLGARKTILQAIRLLEYFCYEAPSENLQSLCMRVVVQCTQVTNTMTESLKRKEKAYQRAQIVAILNSISTTVSILAEHVKKLVFWLDRSPFDENEQYVNWRNEISYLIWWSVRSVTVQVKSLFQMSSELIDKINQLKRLCEYIMRECDDPAVLSTSNVEQAVVRRSGASINWGLNLQSSYRGVHFICEIKEGSPSDICNRIDAGDEILCINGKTVVGWDLCRVAQRLASETDTELRLVVNKRPRELISVKNPARTIRPMMKIAPGCVPSVLEQGNNIFSSVLSHRLSRRRSSTYAEQILKAKLRITKNNEMKEEPLNRLKRRASMSCTEEYKKEKEEPHQPWNLFELLGISAVDPSARIVRRARTMRSQPENHVRSFIDNKMIHETNEDSVLNEQMPMNAKCPTEYAQITVIEPSELAELNIKEPSVTDSEWAAPIHDVSIVNRMRNSAISEMQIKWMDISQGTLAISTDDYIGGSSQVLASPSTCSIPSVNSPLPLKITMTSSIDNGNTSGEDIPLTPLTPLTTWNTNEKIFEGWVRRRKTGTELSENTNKWPKCWMSLKGPYLSIFQNQYTKRADITINVSKCAVSDSVDIRTTKKFVFRLSRPNIDYYFSCYNQADMNTWIQKIGMAEALYGNPARNMSKSLSYYKESDEVSSPNAHYNTLSAFPTTGMSSSVHECLSATSPSISSPRSTFLSAFSSSKSISNIKK